MTVVVWIAEGVWESAVDAARAIAPADADITLLFVIAGDIDEVVEGAFAGLIGRRRRVPASVAAASTDFAEQLLAEAEVRLGRTARLQTRQGRVEREVVTASSDAELLVLSRDGDRSRLGPHSLGPVSRFIVDHAACPVLLVWPGVAPPTESIPPPPQGNPPHERPQHGSPPNDAAPHEPPPHGPPARG